LALRDHAERHSAAKAQGVTQAVRLHFQSDPAFDHWLVEKERKKSYADDTFAEKK
jgi:hypothetical protein